MRKFFFNRENKLKLIALISKKELLFLNILASCGSGQKLGVTEQPFSGLIATYEPPESVYEMPTSRDPFFQILKKSEQEPYWIDALSMDQVESEIEKILTENNNTFTYSFPQSFPDYNLLSIPGWQPANARIVEASREIFSKLNDILAIKFEETSDLIGTNNIAISRSIQSGSAGFSYFPNSFFPIGSDIFISLVPLTQHLFQRPQLILITKFYFMRLVML